jgi:hypothetical protein
LTPRFSVIPVVGHYRGVPLHDGQSPARLELVEREIDRVLDEIDDDEELFAFLGSLYNSPEARLLAASKLEGKHDHAAESRWTRPPFSIVDIRASVAGLVGEPYRHPYYFCSLLDIFAPGQPLPPRRETPLAFALVPRRV